MNMEVQQVFGTVLCKFLGQFLSSDLDGFHLTE